MNDKGSFFGCDFDFYYERFSNKNEREIHKFNIIEFDAIIKFFLNMDINYIDFIRENIMNEDCYVVYNLEEKYLKVRWYFVFEDDEDDFCEYLSNKHVFLSSYRGLK